MSIGDDEQIPDQPGAMQPDDSPTATPADDITAGGQPNAPTPPPVPTSDWHAPQAPAWPPYVPPSNWPPEASGWPPQVQPYAWPTQGPGSSRRTSRLPQFLVVVAAALIAFSGGMAAGRLAFGQTSQDPLSDFAVYDQALKIIRSDYVGNSSVTDQQLLYGSISGMVNSLGDTGHSRFLTPDQLKQEQTDLQGQFVGIGVTLDLSGTTPGVARVAAGSPAEKAGVKAGDQITAVDGKTTAGLSPADLSTLIRGPADTKVTLTIIHAGSKVPLEIAIVRGTFDVPSVDFGMIPGTSIADIALIQFSTGSSNQLQTAIKQAEAQKATGIILDIRDNPGGFANEAIGAASHFLRSGVVYIQQDASGKKDPQKVVENEEHTDLPLVVLVDHNTASAAEIVAGALQDNHRAKIVGVTTFGTGTVLQEFPLSDGSALFLGTEYWLTPSGQKIFGVGIKPDQSVDLPATAQPIDPIDMGNVTNAQVLASGDAQLLAALADLGQ